MSLTAEMVTYAHALLSYRGKRGMGRRVDASAEVYDEKGHYLRIRSAAEVRWPIDAKGNRSTPIYTVVVPPGKPVEIGKVVVGLAFEMRGGAAHFVSVSMIEFTVNPPGTPESGPALIDPESEGASTEEPEGDERIRPE